jgi:hypothetical protein
MNPDRNVGQIAAICFGPITKTCRSACSTHVRVPFASRVPATTPPRPWPLSSQPLLLGPVGMYAATLLTFWIQALLYGLPVQLVSRGPVAAGAARRQMGQPLAVAAGDGTGVMHHPADAATAAPGGSAIPARPRCGQYPPGR